MKPKYYLAAAILSAIGLLVCILIVALSESAHSMYVFGIIVCLVFTVAFSLSYSSNKIPEKEEEEYSGILTSMDTLIDMLCEPINAEMEEMISETAKLIALALVKPQYKAEANRKLFKVRSLITQMSDMMKKGYMALPLLEVSDQKKAALKYKERLDAHSRVLKVILNDLDELYRKLHGTPRIYSNLSVQQGE